MSVFVIRFKHLWLISIYIAFIRFEGSFIDVDAIKSAQWLVARVVKNSDSEAKRAYMLEETRDVIEDLRIHKHPLLSLDPEP